MHQITPSARNVTSCFFILTNQHKLLWLCWPISCGGWSNPTADAESNGSANPVDVFNNSILWVLQGHKAVLICHDEVVTQ
ncbi:MAG: hypothetical protein U0Y68_23715 [Blastocatellia bacterium]